MFDWQILINPFSSSLFQTCHKLVNYSSFFTACEYDVCQMHTEHIGCTSLQSYAGACAEAGVCIEWRNATKGLCGKQPEYIVKMSSLIRLILSQVTNSVYWTKTFYSLIL